MTGSLRFGVRARKLSPLVAKRARVRKCYLQIFFLSSLQAKFFCVERHIVEQYVELTTMVTEFIFRIALKTSMSSKLHPVSDA